MDELSEGIWAEGSEVVEVDWRAVGRRVASVRTLHNWTQEELGDRAGISQHTIAQVELGHREGLRVQTLLDIAEALRVSYQYLLEGTLPEERGHVS